MLRFLACAALLFLTAEKPVLAQGDPVSGEKVFRKCQVCHQIGEDARNKVGPVLTGVFGRQVGTYDGFQYSSGYVELGEQGAIWDEQKLMDYLVSPKAFLKEAGVNNKSRMTYKLRDEQDRLDVISYLKTFSDISDESDKGKADSASKE